MAFRNAQQARVYVGILGASCYARSAKFDSTTDTLDVTTLCDTAKVSIVDQETSSFSVDGPLDVDATTNGQYDAIATIKAATTPTPITYMPLGTDGAVWLTESNETNFTTMAGIGATVDWSMTAQTTGQTDLNGTVLDDNVAVTATQNGSAIDGAAATSNGAVFHLHVTAFTGITSDDVTIEDSATGSSGWATIATFTQATGLTSQRVAITGAVKQYVRVVDTVAGTGSITRHVSMARR